MGPTHVLGTIALVTIALAAALILPIGVPGGSTTNSVVTTTTSITSTVTSTSTSTTSTIATSTISTATTSTTSHLTSISVGSQDGLQLRLSLSADQVYAGGSIMVNVSEFNTLNRLNNVSESGQWQVQAALSSCPNTNFQPFGIAVYPGHYTSQNVSQGTQLQIFPITVCPMFMRLITGYSFLPYSDLAVVLPGSGSTPMTVGIDINGTYAGLGQPMLLNPGAYTVVAADEWGVLAFLYFQVNGLP